MDKPVISNYDELTQAYKKRLPEFLIKGDLVGDMNETRRGQISETARMGTELGSNGFSLVGESLHLMINRIKNGKNTKEEKLKDNIGMVYYITMKDENMLSLRLKSLDY